MTPQITIQALRERLVPFNPDYPLVKIKYSHNAGYMDVKYVNAALDSLEMKIKSVMAGIDELTALEKIALWVLVDSANL